MTVGGESFSEIPDDQQYGMPFTEEVSGEVSEETMTGPVAASRMSFVEHNRLISHAVEMEDWDTFDKLQAITPETPDPRV